MEDAPLKKLVIDTGGKAGPAMAAIGLGAVISATGVIPWIGAVVGPILIVAGALWYCASVYLQQQQKSENEAAVHALYERLSDTVIECDNILLEISNPERVSDARGLHGKDSTTIALEKLIAAVEVDLKTRLDRRYLDIFRKPDESIEKEHPGSSHKQILTRQTKRGVERVMKMLSASMPLPSILSLQKQNSNEVD